MNEALLVALLMRVWLAEAGWSAERDHAIIGHTLLRQAARQGHTDGRSLDVVVEQMVDRHSDALARRPWLRDLGPDCIEPSGYPWAWVPVSCHALAGRAYALLRGELADPCPRAMQWRARGSKALRRAVRAGYRRLACGRTENVYLMEPRRTK